MILELTLNRVRETRKAVFELKGLGLVPDNMVESAQRMLSADGFLPVLEFSPKLMLDAALMTICVGLGIDPSKAVPDWKWSCGAEQRSVEKINAKFQAVLGYEPFLRSKEHVVFSMI